LLQPIKDALGLKTPGIYSISCESGKVYIGQTGHSIKIRIKQHHQHHELYHPDKSAVAEHTTSLGHCIQFNDACIVAKKPRHMKHIIKEAIKMELHPDNMDREKHSSMSKSWKPHF
jgi:predicted GIY-YIG superfamily endonuclease